MRPRLVTETMCVHVDRVGNTRTCTLSCSETCTKLSIAGERSALLSHRRDYEEEEESSSYYGIS